MQVRQNRIVVEIWVSVISPNINFLKVSVMVHVYKILVQDVQNFKCKVQGQNNVIIRRFFLYMIYVNI